MICVCVIHKVMCLVTCTYKSFQRFVDIERKIDCFRERERDVEISS